MSDAEVQCSFIRDVIAYCVRNIITKKKNVLNNWNTESLQEKNDIYSFNPPHCEEECLWLR